jgi:hypothetical protein
MDAPIANLMLKGLLKGYEKQAKKEEKEAEELVARIDSNALYALCIRYDNKTGEYPEHEHEGASVFEFFEKMKEEVKERMKK